MGQPSECTIFFCSSVASLSEDQVANMLNAYQTENRMIFTTRGAFVATLRIDSEEVCSRIIGREGVNIRYIRIMTNTIISSPEICLNRSTKTFKVTKSDAASCNRALLTLMLLADFYFEKIAERQMLTHPLHIRDTVHIPNCLVSIINRKRADFVMMLRNTLGVNIISPRPYCDDASFIIIGHRHNVAKAKRQLVGRIRYLMTKYWNDFIFEERYYKLYKFK